ncbi:MAG: hypothetical protein RRA94_03460 [Bacteroidota bacterium]|nr:hypothetical protein [Bacteroidota bacterium]
MKIPDNFIKKNRRIEIISNDGNPLRIPGEWEFTLGDADMLVAIPDMHMYVYNSPLDNFKYGAKAMLHFLHHLESLKSDMEWDGKKLRIYQLGDMYEYRFPGPRGTGNATAAEIFMSHPDYSLIANLLRDMRAHHLYGNHDYENRHFPGFRMAAREGQVLLEHGFVPDRWQQFSDPGEMLWEAGQFFFLKLREVNEFYANLLIDLNAIPRDNTYSVGVDSGKRAKHGYPAHAGYEDPEGDYSRYLEHYTARLKQPHDSEPFRIAIIGHTHRPYMEKVNGGRQLFIDAGAWTGGRSDFAVLTREEAAICTYRRR